MYPEAPDYESAREDTRLKAAFLRKTPKAEGHARFSDIVSLRTQDERRACPEAHNYEKIRG
jgi:hypothetical protein